LGNYVGQREQRHQTQGAHPAFILIGLARRI
jgi:hypothetical protein